MNKTNEMFSFSQITIVLLISIQFISVNSSEAIKSFKTKIPGIAKGIL